MFRRAACSLSVGKPFVTDQFDSVMYLLTYVRLHARMSGFGLAAGSGLKRLALPQAILRARDHCCRAVSPRALRTCATDSGHDTLCILATGKISDISQAEV